MATRKYQQKRRAEQQSDTRRRIVEAVAALHGEIGPARTTIKAIAERAGVERLTVYRHFADEGALFAACDAHFRAETLPPDPASWADVTDPAERLRTALLAFYGIADDQTVALWVSLILSVLSGGLAIANTTTKA